MSDATQAATIDLDVEANLSEGHGMWSGVLRQMLRRPDVIIGLVITLFFIFVAAFPQAITSVSPQHCDISVAKLHPQGFGHPHPFGTDVSGCDVLAQLAHGARPSLLLAFTVVAASLLIGVFLGVVSGFYLGWVDVAVSRLLEVFLVIPLLLAALLLLTLFRNIDVGDGAFATIIQPAIVLTAFGWMGYTRYVRAAVLEAKNLDYVQAARALGARDRRLMFSHILPNAIAPVTALVPTAIAGIISAEAVLAFLGIGVRPPAISWGIMISNGAPWFTGGYPYLLLFPLGCLLLTVLSLVVIGDNLRDALDPKLK
ncbi:ABC transporter permease [Microlunatus elymi]|uniref:ABC transporter permease n=1 Tax=Microlunatus elymi TaxID=2596828 RepID=A0A516PWB8_9ACTN|nr:ABC transporter permease [Microlunatus elymi]QDP95474.1 ABC transporter permease [Microlunatus elymi]